MYSILYNRDIWTAIDIDECVGEQALKRICPQENKTSWQNLSHRQKETSRFSKIHTECPRLDVRMSAC